MTSLEVSYKDVSYLMKEISKLKKRSELMEEAKRDFETSHSEQGQFHFSPVFMSNRFYHIIKIEEGIRTIKLTQQETGTLVEERSHKSVPNNTSDNHRNPDLDELDVVSNQFILAIDRLLHAYDHNRFEYEMIETIIRTCPKFLTRKNESGEFPFHCVTKEVLSIDAHLFTLFTSVACQNDLGELSAARGGLLLERREDVHDPVMAKNLLQTFVELKQVQRLKDLLRLRPSIVKREDVKKYNLLKYAVMRGPYDRMYDAALTIVKILIEMDPSSVFHPDEEGNIPLYYSFSDSAIIRFIVKSALKFDPFHQSVGGLFTMHECGKYVIDFMLNIKDGENWYQEPVHESQRMREKRHWDGIESIVSPFQMIPILHQTIIHCPHLTPDVLQRFPHSVHLRDEMYRLPIHQALDRGLQWHELTFVLHANSQSIDFVDPVKKLPLFALAASETSCDVRTIYYLLRRSPELLFNDNTRTSKETPQAKKMRMIV